MVKDDKGNSAAIEIADGEKNIKDDKGKLDKDKKTEEEMSEEDNALKEGLELAVTRLGEPDSSLHSQALDHLVKEIKSATSSMTSVPKPLKFLRPHYASLKIVYENWPISHESKEKLADILSVLAMTMAEPGTRECLKFKLEGTKVDIASWGHEYVRSLSGEIAVEYNHRSMELDEEFDGMMDDLMVLVDDIIPFQMKHNAEAEAVDLLLEVQQLKKLLLPSSAVDSRNFERVCLYLVRTADFMPDPDDLANLFTTAYEIYLSQGRFTDALRVALKTDREEDIVRLFSDEVGASVMQKQQMSFLLGRQRSCFVTGDKDLDTIVGNEKLSEYFKSVARHLDVLTPKSPEDIYKSHLAEGGLSLNTRRGTGTSNSGGPVDSARANLASSFVSSFVNAGTGKDTLMTPYDSSWVHKQKSDGMISAVASLGLVMMWDVDEGLNAIEKYLVNDDPMIKAGACLGIGILCSGIRNESDSALALLSENLEDTRLEVRMGALTGLAVAYAGQRREELLDFFENPINNATSISEASMAALALGMTHVGTCNEDAANIIVTKLMEANDTELDDQMSRFMCLGLGLLYMGRTERCEAMMEIVGTIEHKRGKYCSIVLEACAYAGTGDVLKIQSLLRMCAEHLSDPVEANHQTAAVLGIALISLGEDIGTEMSLRTFDHLLHYGELPIRRVVPLSLALLYISNPDYGVVDQLSRLSHDADIEVAMNAIFGLGIISAGTNNSRVAGLLRQLSEFHAKNADALFVVRVSQGLISLAKGLVSISPIHSDRFLLNGPAVAGLLSVLFCFLDSKTSILDKYHYLLYMIVPAINPRYVVTLDENLETVPLNVRVGQALETVGQAGRPKTISGFQTHVTPVLVGLKERAEMASQEYIAMTSILEGTVLVEKKPEEEVKNGEK